MGLIFMPNAHSTGVFDVAESYFQAICTCGWLSTTSFLEEVDLLRALHAHKAAVFGQAEEPANLSVVPVTLRNQDQEGRGV